MWQRPHGVPHKVITIWLSAASFLIPDLQKCHTILPSHVLKIPHLGLPWRSSSSDFAFQCRGKGSIPGGGAKIPHASWPKNQNRSNTVTNSIKTSKMVHIKKKKIPHLPEWTFLWRDSWPKKNLSQYLKQMHPLSPKFPGFLQCWLKCGILGFQKNMNMMVVDKFDLFSVSLSHFPVLLNKIHH